MDVPMQSRRYEPLPKFGKVEHENNIGKAKGIPSN